MAYHLRHKKIQNKLLVQGKQTVWEKLNTTAEEEATVCDTEPAK